MNIEEIKKLVVISWSKYFKKWILYNVYCMYIDHVTFDSPIEAEEYCIMKGYKINPVIEQLY